VTVVYSDIEAAALYDALNPSGPDDDFYLALVLEAGAVLDVGCGTGRMLGRARDLGHSGRLCGVDPDPAMLEIARRRRNDVEWRLGAAAALPFVREFDLAVMMGHAFQCLVGDDELGASLAAIRRALVEDGRFAFETRNPLARAWEGWHGMTRDAVEASGRRVRISYDVEKVAGDVVTFAETTSLADGTALRVDRASLRFLGAEELDAHLADAGLAVDVRYGGWQREPFVGDSAEIVTIARLADSSATRGGSRG
jgi:SAM-dependent methyltransferase